jgi:hypothetical protein
MRRIHSKSTDSVRVEGPENLPCTLHVDIRRAVADLNKP